MACSPKCNSLQASIDVQLLVRGGVFDKNCYATMKRAIIFHSRYTIVWIIFACRPRMFHWIKDMIKTRKGGYSASELPHPPHPVPHTESTSQSGHLCVEGTVYFWFAVLFQRWRGRWGLRVPLTAFTGRGYWSISTSVTSWWRRRRGGISVFFALFSLVVCILREIKQ